MPRLSLTNTWPQIRPTKHAFVAWRQGYKRADKRLNAPHSSPERDEHNDRDPGLQRQRNVHAGGGNVEDGGPAIRWNGE